MHKLLPAALSTAMSISSVSAEPVDARERVLESLNTVLETGQQTVSFGDIQKMEVSHRGLRYTFEKQKRSGCRDFQKTFDGQQGEASASFCASINANSHELSFPIIRHKNIDLRFGGGITEYSNPKASISLSFSHPDIGTHMGKISKIVGDTLYDPFISAELQLEYPMGEYRAYANIQGKYGAYTDSSYVEVGVSRDFGSLEVFVAIGQDNFGVHGGGKEGEIANTTLGGTNQYVTLGAEYCPMDNLCMDVRANHGVSGVGEGQTQINVGVGIDF